MSGALCRVGGAWCPAVGEAVLLREVWRGRVWAARPMIVACRSTELVALWMPAGTEWRAPQAGPGQRDIRDRGTRILRTLEAGGWGYLERRWRMHTLWLIPPGEPYAVWVCWDERWEHLGWYVNFQSPLAGGPRALSAMDLVLDLRVGPDREPRLKDDAYLAEAVARGLIPGGVADRLRELAAVLGDRARAGRGLFAPEWTNWRPDASWPTPSLPGWWADPAAPADPAGPAC